MRYLEIVLFIFCIHVSMAMVNATGIYYEYKQPSVDWFNSVNDESLADESYVQSSITTDEFGWGDFVRGLFYFVVALGAGIIAVPYTLGAFGVIAPFSYYISLIVYLLYFLALAQFVGNRGTRNMS